jgi:gas vesicle protein
MTTSNDPDEIRADIERTRAELSYNVDTLTDTANPKNIANRQVDKVKDAARSVKDRVMGSSDDPHDSGAVGDARTAVSDRAAAVGDAVSDAPRQLQRKTRGNPLAAGLIAFGAGLLISSLIPSSQKEQRAVSELQQNLEPLKQKAVETGREMAGNLQEPAQQAVESVKASATDAVQSVKDDASVAKDRVQDRAEDAKVTVQQEHARA